MTDNESHLQVARAQVEAFESEMEPERLRQAYQALENVVLPKGATSQSSIELRRLVLSRWLELLQVLERHADSSFDPADVPSRLVQPPPTTTGILYPPGADPGLIDAPRARTEYEQAIAANRTKVERYRLQTYLHRLEEPITERVEEFISNAYTFRPADRQEVKAAVMDTIRSPELRTRLLSACYED
jgi:hypothetical protein